MTDIKVLRNVLSWNRKELNKAKTDTKHDRAEDIKRLEGNIKTLEGQINAPSAPVDNHKHSPAA